MDNAQFERIKAGLNDAVAFMQGDTARARIHKVPILRVKDLREKLDMTQTEFAQLIGSTQQTVASWEQASSPRFPVGPTQKLLFLLKQRPELVLELQQLSD